MKDIQLLPKEAETAIKSFIARKYELFSQTDRIKLLFQKEVIRRLTFGDAFEQGSDEETYYCYLVGELYGQFERMLVACCWARGA